MLKNISKMGSSEEKIWNIPKGQIPHSKEDSRRILNQVGIIHSTTNSFYGYCYSCNDFDHKSLDCGVHANRGHVSIVDSKNAPKKKRIKKLRC